MADKTVESAIRGRNGSIKSSANEARPKRGWWKYPRYGSKPEACTMAVRSLASRL